MTLDSGSPNFLTLTNGEYSYPDQANFEISFDDSSAIEDDIKVHTINYTVKFLEYDGIAEDHTSSFTFEIFCPNLVTTSQTNVPLIDLHDYDIAS